MTFPLLTVGAVLPQADTLSPIALYEERVIDLPALYSWLKAAAPDGSGIYADSSRRGNAWIQATTGNQPAVAANWHSLGINAFTFPNIASTNIKANFVKPVGDVSFVVLCEFHTSSSDGLNHVLLGSTLPNASNRYAALASNAKLTIYGDGFYSSREDPTAATLATPVIFSFAISTATQKISIRRNGVAWSDSTMTPGDLTHSDATLQLGAYGATVAYPWYGSIAEALVFNCNLRATRNLYQLQMAEKMLAAKAGITLPY